jgi:dynein heavy chain, axonemal
MIFVSFQLDAKNRMPPLATVLFQEVDRFNNFLKIIHADLKELSKAIKGLVVMSEALEKIFQSFLNNRVPDAWSQKGFLSTKTLGNWMLDFQVRIEFIQQWVNAGAPVSYWICGMFFPQSFLTGTLQTHARRHNIPIDSLKVDFEILEPTIVQSEIAEKRARGEKQLFGELATPGTGVYVHGLFIEAGQWNRAEGGLCEAKIGELTPRLPAVWLKPCTEVEPAGRYEAPLYKTSVRAGVLSTTGHSTNFVLPVLLDTNMPADYWILRGTALITLTTD